MMRLCSFALACGVAGAVTTAVKASQQVVPLTFAGDSCTAVTKASHQLPATARLATIRNRLVGRAVGGTKADQYPRGALARVTGAEVLGRTLTVTLAANPDTCLGSLIPGEPVDAPWIAALDVSMSWVVPSARWARRQTHSIATGQLAPGFAYQLKARCRQIGDARFRCGFSSWAGDSLVVGRGRLAIGRDDEVPHYRFEVAHIDDYCVAVLRRPLPACRNTSTWRG